MIIFMNNRYWNHQWAEHKFSLVAVAVKAHQAV